MDDVFGEAVDDGGHRPAPPARYSARQWLQLFGEIADLAPDERDALFEVIRERVDLLTLPF